MRRASVLLLALALGGCWGPIAWEWPPAPPAPVPAPPPVRPPPAPEVPSGIAAWDAVAVGMTVAEAVALLGPHRDVPQEAGEDVTLEWVLPHEGERYVAWLLVRGGRVVARRLARVEVARDP